MVTYVTPHANDIALRHLGLNNQPRATVVTTDLEEFRLGITMVKDETLRWELASAP